MMSKAVVGKDHWHSDCVTPSQSPIQLTLDNEPVFKHQSFFLINKDFSLIRPTFLLRKHVEFDVW